MSVAYIKNYSCGIKCFPNKWIGKYSPINYPPRSSDLTVLNYYFWGRVKDLVYHEFSSTRDNMIRRISEAIRSFRAEEIILAINCFQNQSTPIKHSNRERRGHSRLSSTPNVRDEGTHMNQAP